MHSEDKVVLDFIYVTEDGEQIPVTMTTPRPSIAGAVPGVHPKLIVQRWADGKYVNEQPGGEIDAPRPLNANQVNSLKQSIMRFIESARETPEACPPQALSFVDIALGRTYKKLP